MTCLYCQNTINSNYLINSYFGQYRLCIICLSRTIREDLKQHKEYLNNIGTFKTDNRFCISCDEFIGRNKSLSYKMVRCYKCINGDEQKNPIDKC